MQSELTLTPVERPAWRVWLSSPLLIVFGFTLAALAVFLFYFMVLNHGIPTWWSDTYEYAVVARNTSQGHILENTAHYVLDTDLLWDYPPPLPYVHHDVGLPLWMGFIMFLLGDTNSTVAWTGGIAYILTVPLTFLLGWKLYNKSIGVFAALMVLINIQLVAFSTTGLSEAPYAFFLTLFLFLLFLARNKWLYFAAGALFGWLWIFRSNSMFLLPWVLLFLALAPVGATNVFAQRGKLFYSIWQDRRAILFRLLPFLIGFLLIVTPNFYRNWETLGSPLYNINSMYALVFNTSVFDGKTKEFLSGVAPNISPPQFILEHPDQLWSKITYQLPRQLQFLWWGGLTEPPTWVDAIQIILLFIGAIFPRKNEPPRQRLFRWMIYLSILTAIVFGSATTLRWRHFYGLIPILMVFVAEVILRLTDHDWQRLALRLQFLKNPVAIIIGVTLIFTGLSYIGIQRQVENGQALDSQYQQMGSWLEQLTTDDALILFWRNDATYGMQNALAWYSHRETAELAPTTAEYFAEKRGEGNLYVMFVNQPPPLNREALTENGLDHFIQVAERPEADGWSGYLFAAP